MSDYWATVLIVFAVLVVAGLIVVTAFAFSMWGLPWLGYGLLVIVVGAVGFGFPFAVTR